MASLWTFAEIFSRSATNHLTAEIFATKGPPLFGTAQVVKLVDTLDSGSSVGNNMEVRVLSWAQSNELILSPGGPSDSGGFFCAPAHIFVFLCFGARHYKSASARGRLKALERAVDLIFSFISI